MDAALEYAKRGWRVLPVHWPTASGQCSCGDVQCAKIGKHPHIKAWNTGATSDANRITEWWRQWPDANIGINTGAESGIWVVDIDDKNDGSNTLNALVDACGPVPPTLTALTGAGRHLFFQHPGVKIFSRVGDLGPGLDTRGDGAYIVAPPSLHANRNRYRWLDATVPIAAAPDWLLSVVTAEPVRSPIRSSTSNQAPVLCVTTTVCIPEGTRNSSLFRIACYLFSSGMARDSVELTMMLFNKVNCQPELATNEVKALVQSAFRYSQQEDSVGHPDDLSESISKKNKKPKAKTRRPIFWFKNVPADNLSNTRLFQLEDYQVGWRYRALDFAFSEGCILPDDANELSKLIRPGSRKEFAAEWRVALFDFKQIELDGKTYLYHPELFSEYMDAASQALVNKANAKKRAEKGAGPHSNDMVIPPVQDKAA